MAARKDGKTGFKADKLWTDAIRVAVKREVDDGKGNVRVALNVLAEKLVEEAAKGNIPAMQEIGNRLEGKPSQAIQHSTAEHASGDVAAALGEILLGRKAQEDTVH